MDNIKKQLEAFSIIASNPKKRIDAYVADNKKVIGCMPVYCPEELVYAAGMVPFGLWGAEIEVSKSKEYFPAFICSIVQTTLEMGLNGDLDQLSGIIIPILCDSLKCMGQNWEQGVKTVEFIPVIHPQNRKLEAGVTFLMSQYNKIKKRLEEISGNEITDDKLKEAIQVYNAHKKVMREFIDMAGKYPQYISPAHRNAVIKSSYFVEKDKHTEMVSELIKACKQYPEVEHDSIRVITSGIIADSPSILSILEENNMVIVADDVAHESRQFRVDVPELEDPIEALARQFANMDNCSVLYDPNKSRRDMIVEQVKKYKAEGIIVLMTKFCDPEEYDYPIMKKLFDSLGIPSVMIEVDQQMRNYEQARTMLQTFGEILR